MNLNNWKTQLRKGILELVVLNMLRHGQCYGYEMVQSLKQFKVLIIREGNIYTILTRLQIDGLVTSYKEASLDGPPRKYFKLTKSGEKAITEVNYHWNQITNSIRNIQKGTYKKSQK